MKQIWLLRICLVSSRPKQRTRSVLIFFVFLPVNASCALASQCQWRVLNPGFLASCWSAGLSRFLQISALASHWLADCANFTGKQQIQRQLLLVQYKQQANPLLSINNYTPLVISRNDKSQRRLALTAKIYFLNYKIIGAPKKCKNQPRPLVRASFVNLFQTFFKSIS